jgi:hypothetical protein
VHPELNYRIVKLRQDELTSGRSSAPVRRSWLDRLGLRRRATRAAAGPPPSSIVLLPPPREERDPAGHDDQRVA